MVNFSNVSDLVTSAKSVYAKRDTLSREEHLRLINEALKKFAVTTTAYSGGLFAAIPIGRDASVLGHAMKNAIKDAKAAQDRSEAETEAEAKAILEYSRLELVPNRHAVMEAVREKKDLFAAANLQGFVLRDMKAMRTLSASLSEALLERAPESLLEEARREDERSDAEIASLIDFYSQ